MTPLRTAITALAALALISLASPLTAQPLADPVGDGLYEAWSPTLMAPVGKLSKSDTTRLVRWLKVKTSGKVTTIEMMPDGFVHWRVEYGPHGPTSKTTLVNGTAWTLSGFKYDTAGHLTSKTVSGAGVPQTLQYTYKTDPKGRVLSRDRTTPLKVASHEVDRTGVRWKVNVRPDGSAVADHTLGKRRLRRDHLDKRGLLTRTDFGDNPRYPMALVYKRNRQGRLTGIRWQLGKRKGAALPLRHTSGITSVDVSGISRSVAERHEVLLLLGEPIRHRFSGVGLTRSVQDDYSPDCWLNEPSQVTYDPADLISGSDAACICGFCVDAAWAVEATEVEGVDLHWTEGPWVRLDNEVDVTADHHLMTPTGPRAAGDLKAGDAVLDERGQIRLLRDVRHLPLGDLRLGRNVRTRSGVFAAGGFLFESERAKQCVVPRRR